MDTILFIRTYSSMRPVYAERLVGAIEAAHARGWRIQTVDKPNHDKIESLLDLWNPSGIIVESGSMERKFPVSLFRRLPVVYLDARHESLSGMRGRIGCVEHDGTTAARIAAKELLSGDCASYAFVPNFVSEAWSRDREATFRQTLDLHNKPLSVFRFRSKAEDMPRWHTNLRKFLEKLPKPCGVFAANDPVGESVLVSCADIGLAVPNDVSVVGVDDQAVICENTTPTLSSITLDFTGAGRMSVDILDKLIHSKSPALEIRTFGALGLTRRASSRRLRRNDPDVARALETIRTRACEGISAEQVLSGMKCSRRLAEIRFRAATGSSPLEAIQSRRMERACELLATTKSNIDTIANMCGYGSAVFLQKLFHRALGTTPSKWRARQAANAASPHNRTPSNRNTSPYP